jgi:hypothetical protein
MLWPWLLHSYRLQHLSDDGCHAAVTAISQRETNLRVIGLLFPTSTGRL